MLVTRKISLAADTGETRPTIEPVKRTQRFRRDLDANLGVVTSERDDSNSQHKQTEMILQILMSQQALFGINLTLIRLKHKTDNILFYPLIVLMTAVP